MGEIKGGGGINIFLLDILFMLEGHVSRGNVLRGEGEKEGGRRGGRGGKEGGRVRRRYERGNI